MNALVSRIDIPAFDPISYDAAVRAATCRAQHSFFDQHVIEDEGYGPILDAIAAELDRGVVYVHCWGGVGRTGTVVGCLLADRGLGYDEALAELAALRAGTRKGDRAAPETDEQRAVIRRRAERPR